MPINTKIEHNLSDKNIFMVKISDGTSPVGNAIVNVQSSEAELKSIWVKPGHRGKGMGSKLFEKVKSYSAAMGASQLRGEFIPVKGEEEDGLKFYSKHGVSIQKDKTWQVDLTK